MATENLTVAYHQQDTDYYCGAACAQMVLDSIGAGLLDQNSLYADNHSHSTIETFWYTGPDGLQWTMNDRRPPGFGNYFALFALGTEEQISRKICWTIHHYQVAPIALVYGWNHWIVVRGFDASALPTSSLDNSYTMTAFDLNNPWPPTPSPAPPPPHHNGTDGCGTGGTRGIANEHITYAAWKSTYMTGVPAGHWMGQFVAVCDPEPPAPLSGQPKPPFKRFKGDSLISREQASESALAGLEQFGLAERKDWKKPLQKTKPGEPLLVHRLDRIDDFYYIVPLETGPRRVPAAVIVDGRFGDYQQAIALPERGTTVLAFLSQQAVLKQVVGQRIELGTKRGQIVVRPEAHCLYPTLVWRPCRESLSPFYPFYMLTVGSQRIYVRIDGAVFTTLHTSDRGI